MKQIVYRPGRWQVAVEDRGVVAVPAEVAVERIERIHRLLHGRDPGLTEVIDALSDGSLSSLGSFAIALIGDEGVRVAVRGTVTARIETATGTETASGAEISTWTERFLAGASAVELALGAAADGGADPVSDRRRYPVRSGVVLAGDIRVEAAADPWTDAPVDDAVDESVDAAAPADSGDARPEADPGRATDADDASSQPEMHTLIPTELTFASVSDAAGDDRDEGSVLDGSAPEDTVQGDGSREAMTPAAATPVAAPAAPPAPVPPAPPASADDGLGDHDGATITLAELRRQRGETAPPTAGPDAPTALLPASPPVVHGRARVSTGQVVELDRAVIIGRRPRATRASGESMPHLIAVDSPQQDISRNHLEIRPEGDSVVVVDLRTTNGSTLLRPGADPVRLHPAEPTLVLDGDVVDLGDGVTVAFEGLI